MSGYIDAFRFPYFVSPDYDSKSLLAKTVDCYHFDQGTFTVCFNSYFKFEVDKGFQKINEALRATYIILQTFAFETTVDLRGKKCSLIYDGPQYGFLFGEVLCLNSDKRTINPVLEESFQYPIDHYTLAMRSYRDGFSFSISKEYLNDAEMVTRIKNLFFRLGVEQKV
jgi:hypothetical protein